MSGPKLKPMPELALVDPITGVIPKNYREILANRKRKADNDKCKEDTEKITAEPKSKLKPMPEIFLIDPITGLIPKNYKQIIAERRAGGLPIHTYPQEIVRSSKRLSQFKVSNIVAEQAIPKNVKPDSTGHTTVTNKCVRKALFVGGPKRTSGLAKRTSIILKRTSSADSNDTLPLLDFEDSGEELHIFRKIPRPVQKKLPASNLTPAKKNGKLRSSKSSNSSMEDFLKHEEQCKTPKSIMKVKQQPNVSNRRNVNNKHKMNALLKEVQNEHRNIQDTMKKIEELNQKVNESNRKIKEKSLKIERLLNDRTFHTGNNMNSTHNEENSQLPANDQSSHNLIRNETTLRVSTLKKNLERKVLFNLQNNNTIDSPVIMQKPKVVLKTMQTPNTMVRTMKSIAEEQYSKLQDTPKVSR